jgi:hypothetical protein
MYTVLAWNSQKKEFQNSEAAIVFQTSEAGVITTTLQNEYYRFQCVTNFYPGLNSKKRIFSVYLTSYPKGVTILHKRCK